jgi:hypothetical protein
MKMNIYMKKCYIVYSEELYIDEYPFIEGIYDSKEKAENKIKEIIDRQDNKNFEFNKDNDSYISDLIYLRIEEKEIL